jgi:ketosteroid isomerase-like protein
MDPAAVVRRFYEAFARRDAIGMAACYHPDATFEDPVFGPLDRAAACAMWAMLAGRATDLTVSHTVVAVAAEAATAHWEARYTFTRTGRPVHNRITATFTLQDGLIRTHRDAFDVWTWSRQAFGLAGLLLGWAPWFQNKVRSEALRSLATYRSRSSL